MIIDKKQAFICIALLLSANAMAGQDVYQTWWSELNSNPNHWEQAVVHIEIREFEEGCGTHYREAIKRWNDKLDHIKFGEVPSSPDVVAYCGVWWAPYSVGGQTGVKVGDYPTNAYTGGWTWIKSGGEPGDRDCFATHELGHILGLDHYHGEGEEDQLMHKYYMGDGANCYPSIEAINAVWRNNEQVTHY